MRRSLAILAAAACVADAAREAKPARMGSRTLCVIQDSSIKDTHSKLLDGLKKRGHTLTVKSNGDSVDLERHGEQLYDNVLILASSASGFPTVDVAELTAFADNGGNLLVAAGPNVPANVRRLASEFGVDFDEAGTRVIDHFSYDTRGDSGDHTRVLSGAYFPSRHVVGKLDGSSPIVYEGTGLSTSPENILALRILTASTTGYSANPSNSIEKFPASAGRDTVLVAGIQARNNARAVFIGSLAALSDDAFAARVQAPSSSSSSKAANAAFAEALTRWAFQESGVLRASNLRHAHQDGTPAEWQVTNEDKGDMPPAMFPLPEIARQTRVYRIKDDVVFAVDIHHFNGTQWEPYTADDVQLEFVMLDPYVRTGLKTDGNGTFATSFRVPDVYGIYHFRVMYRRPGLTTLYLRDQVSVRPFLHNEYERYILSAYPYYASAFAMMAGVFVFSLLFLYAK